LRTLKIALVLAAALAVIAGARHVLHHRVPPPSAALLAQAKRVRILRDTFGVPHVFGETDADAAFGLAYAHAEDDFPTIQGVTAASTGRLSLLQLSQTAVLADWLAGFVGVSEAVDEQWPKLDERTRALLDSYANGLNLYAALHPDETDARLLPFSGRDLAAGFAYKMPLLLGLPELLQRLREEAPKAGTVIERARPNSGSNAHALAPFRSSDGVTTRLNINSHQPWEGPVAWYEAEIVSKEGWKMYGGLFPGAPLILLGFNDFLGWAHTVNTPALVDAYELQVRNHQQLLDGVLKPLRKRKVTLHIDIGFMTVPVPMTFEESAQGPVFEAKDHLYGIRWVGRDRGVLTSEQWYRMNRASSVAEWKAAMELQRIPMFNAVFASRDGHIGYVYNALLPLREDPRLEPGTILDGTRSAAIWTRYLPYDELPRVDDPPSGFVFNTNATPFAATTGAGNPDGSKYPPAFAIERTRNNRALRSLQLFGGDDRLTREEFVRRKFDRAYAPESPLAQALAQLPQPKDDAQRQAEEILRGWNRVADEGGPALPILFARELRHPQKALEDAVQLLNGLGRLDLPLGEVQRLRRGKLDLPLGGGPDVLNAASDRVVDGRLVGKSGDSLVVMVDFAPQAVFAESVNVYGASNRPESPHYADQAPLFVRRELKPVWREEDEIRRHLEREYSPGQ
jgi:penicillin amidase/acyl-homoserine-lactone acylase